ncbi:MAG TPA: 5,10-methylenetetrahydrofolate reductase, partial [Rhodobacterales bacterium]|nr:5,10-methylenetetrahydrofolate reductase [Rhodobacterales bacterium]
ENWAGVRKFADNCGTKVPAWVNDAFEKAARDGREELLSVALAAELCSDLIDGGVEDLHFYTLNKPYLTRDIAHALGVQPQAVLQKVA